MYYHLKPTWFSTEVERDYFILNGTLSYFRSESKGLLVPTLFIYLLKSEMPSEECYLKEQKKGIKGNA
jgi:hypothetical protein